jgi:hypothetical protein
MGLRGELPEVVDELGGADLGDTRLTKRLATIAERIGDAPGESFPKLARSDAELEATYRFLNNPKVTPDAILAPHFRATCARAADAGKVLVLHDTSVFIFDGEQRRPGLGFIKGGQGFVGHFALAATANGTRTPLGLLGVMTIFRDVRGRTRGLSQRERYSDPDKERLRWAQLAEVAQARVEGAADAVHVMDREADSFELLSMMADRGIRFVVRGTWDRRLEGTTKRHSVRVSDVLARAKDMLTREVQLSARSNKDRAGPTKRIHPARKARMARLKCRAARVTLWREQSRRFEHLPRTMTLNVVRVREVGAPRGDAPVQWILLTTEPVDTADQIASVVDAYRARWLIEEYFKALKTGCQFEKRQLENRSALKNALALLAPVAWRLLLVRSVARAEVARPAATVLTPIQLRLLRMKSKRVRLPEHPTAAEAMLAVAGLGGHLKRNGAPGWQTLGRGLEALLLMEAGWAARDAINP